MISQNSQENPRGAASSSQLRRRFLPAWALMAVAATVLGGCQLIPTASPDTTRFYVLSGPALVEPAVAKAGGRLQIGLRAVDMPAYLRATKSIVVRSGSNEIRYQDYSRWAEPLDAGVSRILKDRLMATPEVAGVTAHPMRGDVARNYDVAVRILHCEGVAGENPVARFAASYEIIAADDSGKVVLRRTFNAPDATWDGKDFSKLAASLGEGVAALCAEIAANLPK
ncbi:MAG: PqiC family protein [Nibricoccus sp.]